MADGVDPQANRAHAPGFDTPRASLPTSAGWRRSYMPGTTDGKLPWRLRWLGVPALLALCAVSGWWAWDHMEDQLDERALTHLGCEDIDTTDLSMDWSYRSVTVAGQLPNGVSAAQVEQIIDGGSSDVGCLERAGIDAAADPGVYGVTMLAATGAAAAIAETEPAATAVPATAIPVATPAAEPEPEPTEESAEPAIATSIDASAGFDGETITLAGLVTSEDQRQTIVDAASRAVGEENVVDELEVADGEPSAISDERAAEFATLISQFDSATVTEADAAVDDAAVTYAVLASSGDARDTLDLPGTGTIDVPATADAASDDSGDHVEADADTPAAAVEFTG